MKKRMRWIILILILLVPGGIFACRGLSASAREMKLVKTDGKVHVSDETNQEKPIKKNMNLYSGYGIGTESGSYAWIDLDKTKLLKMDEDSSVNLLKDGRKLKIRLESGDIFFCVTKPLTEEEGLEFENSNTAMSIRGTTGIFRSISADQSQLVLMEGSVSLQNGQSITTGQVADLKVDEDGQTSVTTREVTDGDVPEYVLQIIEENKAVKDKIISGGGRVDYMTEAELMAIYGDLIRCYREALAGEEMEYSTANHTRYLPDLVNIAAFEKTTDTEPAYRPRPGLHGFEAAAPAALRGWQYAFFDINHDGWPELLIADNTLEDGWGIRDIWTTDGVEAKRAVWPPSFCESMKITANGYIAIESTAEYLIGSGTRTYYSIEPSGGVGRQVFHTEEGGAGRPAWTGVVYDESGQSVFESESEEEFDGYMGTHFPPVHDLSLNWRSFN